MTPDTVIELGRQGMNITVLLAAPLLLLAAPAGRFITGQVLVVDGGAIFSFGRYS